MILVCDVCKARYLVPASAFAGGPRQVRCARCNHEWFAELQGETPTPDAMPAQPLKEATAEAAPPPPPPPPIEEPPAEITPIPPGSNLPALRRESIWSHASVWAGLFLAVIVLALLAAALLGRGPIVKRWPGLEGVYNVVGISVPHPGDGFSLQNINSERRFDDGAMLLVVTGELRNDTAKPLPTPAIQASAIGADGTPVREWNIMPTVSVLPSGASSAFESTLPAPDEAVDEVNLRFIERVEKPAPETP